MIRKLINLLAPPLAIGVTAYTYISKQTANNKLKYINYLTKKEHKKVQIIPPTQLTKNKNQQTINYYDQITKQIDTGDIVFIYVDYSRAIDPINYLKGFSRQFWKGDGEFDGFGYVYKNGENTYVYYNQFGVSTVKKYQQFIDLPYVVGVIIQKNQNKSNINIPQKLANLIEKTKGNVNIEAKKQSAVELANRVNQILYEKHTKYIMDLRQLLSETKSILIKTRAGNQVHQQMQARNKKKN